MNRAAPRAPADKVPAALDRAVAHLRDDGEVHLLADHLRKVGDRAASFAEAFASADAARMAGRWHDLGKYQARFQKMIHEENNVAAHIESFALQAGDGKRDHSTAGALWAKRKLGSAGGPIATVIAGHHAGLGDTQQLKDRFKERAPLLDEALAGTTLGRADEAWLEPMGDALPTWLHTNLLNPDGSGPDANASFRRLEMWTRFLFSSLCDADFLDTEGFFNAEQAARRGAAPAALPELERRLRVHLDALAAAAVPSEVNRVRTEVRDFCDQAAAQKPGLFTLTVPTGGGKTLAAMSFALRHAAHHDLRRVVVAIPFTSILEQNADVYRQALGASSILEHHSALEPKKETPWNRLATENWDASIVVTTTVQLFESLFASRTSRCRKLHNLAGAVLVLDEVQTLPTGLLDTLVDGLRILVRDYGTTVVLCTATQPALTSDALAHPLAGEVLSPALVPAAGGGGGGGRGEAGAAGVRSIIPTSLAVPLHERLRRVAVHWPAPGEVLSYAHLAQRLANHANSDAQGERAAHGGSSLAIVHARKDARLLTLAIDEATNGATDEASNIVTDAVTGGHAQEQPPASQTLHLSALMCPEHRSAVLATIKRRQQAGEPVRLVATQLVEAGVDLDFPLVYRALAGLDSLAQAAGRCNREGRLSHIGELRVFRAETKPPPGVPQTALAVTEQMLAFALSEGRVLDIFAPATQHEFFRQLYGSRDLDEKGVQALRAARDFRAVAQRVKLIEDEWSAPLVVPYGEGPDRVVELEQRGPSRSTFRALQRFTINVARRDLDRWFASGVVRLVCDAVHVLDPTFDAAYSGRFGLVCEEVGAMRVESTIV